MSNRDSFWGAKPNQGETTLIGINILGQLLTSLRDELRRQKGYTGETVTRYLTGVKTNTLVINGKTVIGKDSEWPVNFLMVAHGWAYHYKEPSAMRNHCLLEAERIAKDSRKGVWQDGTNGGIRPWEHRRNRAELISALLVCTMEILLYFLLGGECSFTWPLIKNQRPIFLSTYR